MRRSSFMQNCNDPYTDIHSTNKDKELPLHMQITACKCWRSMEIRCNMHSMKMDTYSSIHKKNWRRRSCFYIDSDYRVWSRSILKFITLKDRFYTGVSSAFGHKWKLMFSRNLVVTEVQFCKYPLFATSSYPGSILKRRRLLSKKWMTIFN